MASAFVSSRPRTRRCVRTLTNSCNVCTICLRLNRRRTLFLLRCCPQLPLRAIFTPCNRASLASKINWVRLSSADSFNSGVFTLSILSCQRTSPFATQERSQCARRDQCRSHVRSLGCFLTRCISNPIQKFSHCSTRARGSRARCGAQSRRGCVGARACVNRCHSNCR